MTARDLINPDAASATAYANRLLLLNLVEELEARGLLRFSLALAKRLSHSAERETQCERDAISELADQLEGVSKAARHPRNAASSGV